MTPAAALWVRFATAENRSGFGVLQGDRIVEYSGDMFDSPRVTGLVLDVSACRLLAPCRPTTIVALWNNFHALAAKLGKSAPEHPFFLLKPASCVIGPEEDIRRPSRYEGKIAFEGELGIVIGRRCKEVSPEAALEHIFGYTCVNDVTASAILNESTDFAQWCRAKGCDTFGAIGPAIATRVDLPTARVRTRLGAEIRQDYPVSDMVLQPGELLSALSYDMTLMPGDVIACGTSLGVGSIAEGVAVEIEIDGIGTLRNYLRP